MLIRRLSVCVLRVQTNTRTKIRICAFPSKQDTGLYLERWPLSCLFSAQYSRTHTHTSRSVSPDSAHFSVFAEACVALGWGFGLFRK